LADLAETWLFGRAEMASNYDDRNRWKNHLLPVVGELEPNQVDVPVLKRLIVTLRQKGLSKGTVRLCVALLSSLYGDLVEDGVAKLNPTKLLSRKTRTNELRPDHDPKRVPFLQTAEDVARVYRALLRIDGPVALAFFVAVRLGLRTSEVRALRWEHVDLDRRLVHVQVQVARRGGGTTDLKDDDSRLVPIPDDLYELLQRVAGRSGLVCGVRWKSQSTPLGLHRIGATLRVVLPEMTWYQATRHSFASQWVISGGSLETLCQMMGHSSVMVTERYAHLIPGRYTDVDRARVSVDLPATEPTLTN